jgi:uncharacterized glyoxalase superfamily protein PhnB
MTQRVIPMIAYEDAAAAIDWLAKAFGFRERLRYTEDDGRVTHAELELDGGVIMLATPTPDYASPKRLRETSDLARKSADNPFVVDGLMIDVEDVDALFARAKEAGATILSEPADVDVGVRHCRIEDPEGHRWMFSQTIAQVAPEEWGAVEA